MTIKPFDRPLRVTRPNMPSLASFTEGLERIWDAGWLSNHGPVLRDLESRLSVHFGTDRLALLSNGSLALEAALLALDLDGEVITTPFTYVATGNAIARCGLEPVFADIDPHTLTLDVAAVEAAVTSKTSAILAVHVFGQPCDLEGLQGVADRHGLKLIYDAAHAFDIRVQGRPIGQFGDASMFSLHATKPIQAAEGGLLIFSDRKISQRIFSIQNHGIDREGMHTPELAMNAKLSELHALMGQLSLDLIDDVRGELLTLEAVYRESLAGIPGVRPATNRGEGVEGFFSFFPILIGPEARLTRDVLAERLTSFNVFPRKYFAPLLSDMPAFSECRAGPLPIATGASESVLALPYFAGLAHDDARQVSAMIRKLIAEAP